MLQAVSQLLDVGVQALETLVRIAPVDIAEGDNVLAGKVDEVLAAHAANAHAGDVQQIAGRCETPSEHVARHKCGGCTTSCRGAQEFPARQSLLFVVAAFRLVVSVFFRFLYLFSHHALLVSPSPETLSLDSRCMATTQFRVEYHGHCG